MARRSKHSTQQIAPTNAWCPSEWIIKEFPKLVTKTRMQRGHMGRSMTSIAAHTVESAIIAEGEKYLKRATTEFRLKPDERLFAFCIAPISKSIEASIATCRLLRSKITDKKKRLLNCMVVPEPRHNGHAHYNIVIKVCAKDVMDVLAWIKAIFKRHNLIFKPWTDPDTDTDTEEFIYTHEQQCIDDNANRTPGPLRYALKTTLSWAGLKSHNIIAELNQRKTKDRFSSAIQAKTWRRTLRLRITFTYRKHQSLNRAGFAGG